MTDIPMDREYLQRFLLGLLDEFEQVRVEELLGHAAEGPDLLEDPCDNDPLTRSLRAIGAETMIRTDLPADLLRRLEELSSSNPTVTQAPNDTNPQSPVGAADFSLRSDVGAARTSEHPYLDAPESADELGRLSGYRVLRALGAGGMGMVFLAEDPLLKRKIALKVMRPEYATRGEARRRFLREAQAIAALEHENVVPIYQVGEAATPTGSMPFIAMPLLMGESLASRLKHAGALPLATVVRLGREAAAGLAAAHAAGLVHRDVKPDNLWVCRRPNPQDADSDEQLKVLDFGLARALDGETDLTQVGTVMGTPAYMSPEQANGEPADPRSDLFSLGCVLYEMATGQKPFQGTNVASLLKAVVEHHPPSPCRIRTDIPESLSHLIDHLLAKKREDRPASARIVMDALRAIERGDECHLTAPSTPQSRRRWFVRAALGVLAVLVATAVFWPTRRTIIMGEPATQVSSASKRPLASFAGLVDVRAWSKVNDTPRSLRLTEPGALPLNNGDQIRISGKISSPAFLYLLWIDSEGKAEPLYPWRPGEWGTRPSEETPVSEIELPRNQTRGFTLRGGATGMETVVLLARENVLTTEEEASLRQHLAGLPLQQPVQNERSAVWFENGKVVENDANRRRAFFVEEINDPVLRMQELLQSKMQPYAQFTAAVSFARKGP